MAKEVFASAIKEAIPDLRNKALQSGVQNESIESVISGVYSQAGNYSFTMAVRKVTSALNNLIRAASAETLSGVFVGSRDRVGKNVPMRFTLLTTDKKHLEISNFGTTAPYLDKKIEIECPSLVTIRAEHDKEFDSWNLVSIEKFQKLEKSQLVKILSKVVIPISAINQDFAYKQGEHSARPVVISGEIGRISPEAVFKHEEDSEGNRTSTIDHHLPVICQRELDKEESLPCFGFVLNSKTRGTNSARCHIQQTRNATPVLMINDLDNICNDAVNSIREPEGQATAISEWLRDLPVIVVGVVSSYKRTVSESKSEQNWIDIGVSCVVDIEGMTIEGSGVQQQIPSKKEEPAALPSTPKQATTQSEPVPGPITKTEGPAAPKKRNPPKEKPVEAPQAPAGKTADQLAEEFSKEAGNGFAEAVAAQPKVVSPPSPAQAASMGLAGGASPQQIKQIVKAIKFYCGLAGIKPSDVTVAHLKQKALDIVGDVPDSVIETAIEFAKE